MRKSKDRIERQFLYNGITYSCHPSIDVSASVNELKKRGMWKKDARVVMSRGVIDNIDAKILSSDTDRITSMFYKCHGCQEHRQHLRMHRRVFIQKEEADI